eukprot:TRINITY_DN4034_c0_g2_i19.p1 TRINITY_DN4034_c0_g2~~TRINITY_DN4034_c0_g2_i19.p1  ORF type:complete len:646 (-),score=104.18 TRINITY_DN4034_c0_g2_i19:99-2036(-)
MYKRPVLENQHYQTSYQNDTFNSRYNGNEHILSDNLQGVDIGLQASGSSSGRGRSVRADHLLNFKYDQGGGSQRMQQWRRNSRANNGYYNNSYQKNRQPKYSKEQYIQANFKFYVSDCVDLEKHSKDPDLAFVWEDVAWVEMMTDSELQCPISLESPPFCPQITPCGHLFSFPQIVHYLYLQDNSLKTPHPCPLCFTPLTARELRDVRIRTVQNATVGENMEFVLVRREKKKQMVEAVDEHNFYKSNFSKYVPISDATDIYVDTVKKLAESASQTIKEGGSEAIEEVPYLYSCVDVTAIKARCWTYRRAQLQINPQQIVGSESAKDIAEINQRADAVETFVRQAFMKSDLHGTSEEPSNTHSLNYFPHPTKPAHHHKHTAQAQDTGSSYYYFYQCADGQQIFLLPLNAKCMLAQYGTWENCPRRVSGEVLQVEEKVQGEEERKRWKFLAHLPQSATFKFCEIKMDLQEFPAAEQFSQEILKRQRSRDKAAAKKVAEDAQAVPTLVQDVYPSTSYVQIPSISDWQAMPALSSSSTTTANNKNTSTNEEGSSPPRPGVSFANITKSGYAAISTKEIGLKKTLPQQVDVKVQGGKQADQSKQMDYSVTSAEQDVVDTAKNIIGGGKKQQFKGKVKGKKLSLMSFQRKL